MVDYFRAAASAGAGTAANRAVLAEVSGPDLQDGLRSVLQPKLLAAFDPPVDLLDGALHRRAADEQPQPSIARVIHAPAVIGDIGDGFRTRRGSSSAASGGGSPACRAAARRAVKPFQK